MSQAKVRIPTPLRPLAGGAGEVAASGATVGEVLRSAGERHPGLVERLLDGAGEIRSSVHVYLGDSDVRSLDGLDSTVAGGAVIHILPAVAGGAVARQRRLRQLRETVSEVTALAAFELQQQGAVVVDVRERDELAAGSPLGAECIVRGFLELQIEDRVPDLGRTVLVMCAGGTRSLFAARNLQELGYADVRSVAGGFTAWKREGLPVEIPRLLSVDDRERYGRHVLIPEIGEAGQLRLLESKVLIVGAGGLGSPAAFYLAAAGVGTIALVDDDMVDRSNLQRQILHTDDRVGTPKVESARLTLTALNPSIRVIAREERLTGANVEELFDGYDVVVDGCDNFATRYLVNDACVALGIPNVHGAIFRFEGQLSVFWPSWEERRGPCYRCLFPEPPPPELAPSCAEAGVLGVLPGVIGTLEAVEAVKILLGVGDPLVGRLVVYDALEQRFTELQVERDPACPRCGDGERESGYADYGEICAVPA
jgi:molybdopterin/thiamine biosynthesis adenylyltransferase/rhodanese-related sulfurtransferase/molybdopterin converting factor small subunit